MPAKKDSIIIVGAGWAGLSAALTLARSGRLVTVLEAAPKAGGRARAIDFAGTFVDNGQHLFMGAYQHILTVADWLKIPEDSLFYRTPLKLLMLGPETKFQLTLPNLPSPLHFLIGFMTLKGLSTKDRLRVIQFCRVLHTHQFQFAAIHKTNETQDISVLEFLQQHQQSQSIIEKLWGPIVLAALSTPVEKASSTVFLNILKKILSPQTHSHWLFPKVDLSQVLPIPIEHYLKKTGNAVLYRQRVKSLILKNGHIRGVETDTNIFLGSTVILATPPQVTAELLNLKKPLDPPIQSTLDNIQQKLLNFRYQPITTVYLRYAKPVSLPLPMVGLLNQTGHWVFDRAIAGQPDILSVVITGFGSHLELDHKTLIQKITQELNTTFKEHFDFSNPIASRVITEKRAAFDCSVGIEHTRPTHQTPYPTLWLVGDYTAYGYPATLEGAVQSGIEVAKLILCKNICSV